MYGHRLCLFGCIYFVIYIYICNSSLCTSHISSYCQRIWVSIASNGVLWNHQLACSRSPSLTPAFVESIPSHQLPSSLIITHHLVDLMSPLVPCHCHLILCHGRFRRCAGPRRRVELHPGSAVHVDAVALLDDDDDQLATCQVPQAPTETVEAGRSGRWEGVGVAQRISHQLRCGSSLDVASSRRQSI